MEFIGIDIGATKTAFRYLSANGAERDTVVRWSAGQDDIEVLRGGLREAVGGRRPLAAGVAVPASLDAAGRVVAWPNRPHWRGVDLRAVLRADLTGASVCFGDDGDLATLAEARQAGGRDLLYVGVGTGVGGGLFLAGDLLRSPHGPVAEIGHVVVVPNGPLCQCGRQGCLQAVASGPAMLRWAEHIEPTVTDARMLRAEVHAGVPWAQRAVHRSAHALATAVVTVAELVRPELVRLGGGFMAALPELATATASAVRALGRPGFSAPVVEPAAYGGMSSLAGAVLVARHPELTQRYESLAG
ncbi:hypothetical protein ALI144C_36485 [Actinosynnema sp. ALI-1.44]|uniref:ROK family protein n=1 Tax=Actinosynnema sp. ALI-1.44 TaxID=1933779 RepID=UPI00097C6042|nr:ROK family protein [Actinosynnema sp. ALI-1.44]ONI76175.1 hypothetical protein ALI144C_36485 [Actinosynnema sp. ALI-1.44]